MADFEEKLNAILSSPESMQQEAQLAQMLSSQSQASASPPDSSPAQQASPPMQPQSSPNMPAAGGMDLSSLSSLLGGIDMGTISRFLPLLQEMNSNKNDERTALLHALKPFLRPERQAKVDTALRLARLFHVGKVFFKGFGEQHV